MHRYKVIMRFADLSDNKHVYEVGDTFPRQGLSVSDERIEMLLSAKNKTGNPVILRINDEKDTVHDKKAKRK